MTEDQRKAYLELIREAERRFEKNFERDFDSLKRELAPKLEGRSRVRNLFDNVRSLRTKLSEALLQLQRVGFRVDDGMIAIDYEPQDGGAAETGGTETRCIAATRCEAAQVS